MCLWSTLYVQKFTEIIVLLKEQCTSPVQALDLFSKNVAGNQSPVSMWQVDVLNQNSQTFFEAAAWMFNGV